MSGKTFLTMEIPPDIQAQFDKDNEKNDKAWHCAEYICNKTLEAFELGEITLADSLAQIQRALDVPKLNLKKSPRDYKVFYTEQLNRAVPKARTRNSNRTYPSWIKIDSILMIERLKKKAKPVQGPSCAFERLHILFGKVGIDVPVTTLKSWLSKKNIISKKLKKTK